MTNERSFKISVGSAVEFDDFIAEIFFPGKAGLIISQEKAEGDFEVSLHGFSESAVDDFDDCRNVDSAKVPLAQLLSAIDLAVSELRRLKKD